MGILPDWMVKRDVKIEPFDEGQSKSGKLSSGLGSYGYDARVGYKFKVFSPVNATEVDPKAFDPKALVGIDLTPEDHDWEMTTKGSSALMVRPQFTCRKCKVWTHHPEDKKHCKKPDFIRIPPNSFCLAETMEHFEIPRDCLAIVLGKSTYARCGLITPMTPLEPGWRGRVTVEISNTTPLPAKVYAGEGIVQVVFIRSDGVSESALWSLVQTIAMSCGAASEIMIQDLYRQIQRPVGSLVDVRFGPRGTCDRSYADKKGRYNDQTGLTLPFVEGDNK
jgi:dCTP deaminase